MIRSSTPTIVALVTIATLAVAPNAIAQPIQHANIAESVSVGVTSVYKAPPANNELRKLFSDILEEELAIAGFKQSDTPFMNLIVSAIPVPGDYVAISIAVMQRLPEPIVDFSATNEVFYLTTRNVELPEEGKMVRQYMSRDYMERFEMLTDQFETVTKADDLRSAAKATVDAILTRHESQEEE